MRRVVALVLGPVVLATFVAGIAAGPAAAGGPPCWAAGPRSTMCGGNTGGGDQGGGPVGVGGGGPVRPIPFEQQVFDLGNGQCTTGANIITFVVGVVGGVVGMLAGGIPVIPGLQTMGCGRAVPLPSPQQVAQSFVAQMNLPNPTFEVKPGWGITGKPAYLHVTGGNAQQANQQTILGPLTLSASSSSFVVDWGDGSTDTFSGVGGDWPDGPVHHVYENVGTYTITLTEHWGVAWSVGGQNGTITTEHTAASKPFPVRQVEAVVGSSASQP